MNYTKLAATALKLIKNAGRPVTFYTTGTTGGYDVNGDPIADSPGVTKGGYGVKLGYKTREYNEFILRGDSYLIYSGEKPEIQMLIDLDGTTWQVVNVDPLEPAGTNLLYKVQLRR